MQLDLKIFSGSAHPELADEIAAHLGLRRSDATVKQFPDGETFVKINENIRKRDIFIVQPTCPPTNQNLMELLIMVDAARRASAESITAVIPFFGYARQDRKDQPRVPITAKLVANLLTAAGVPWGHVSSGCIYSGSRADGAGFTETDTPNFTFRTNHCSFYSGTKALGEEVLAATPSVYLWRLRIPFNEVENSRNYLTKLMRYARLLEAENSISQLDEFCAATFACWEKRVPFGTYNVTNPGKVTTHEVVDLIKRSGVCSKDYVFFKDEDEFMHAAAKTPRSNCVMDSAKLASVGIHLTEVHDAVAQALRSWRKA